jgi:phosphate-selective porin OprO and OprP
MKHTKLVIAMAATLSATASFSALAMDLYVDSKTKQVFTEPGKGRVLLTDSANVKSAHTPFVPAPYVAPVAATDIDAIKKDLEMKTNAIAALEEHAKEESDPKNAHVKLDDGIHFATKDGNFTAGINGRLQVDSQTNVNQALANGGYPAGTVPAGVSSESGVPIALSDGMALRRARLGVEGTFFKNTFYKFEYDFTRAGTSSASTGVTDAFIGYNFTKESLVKVGAFKEPFSLEEATSNRYLTFIERHMAVNTFVDNLNTYKLGIGANYATDRWMVATSLQTESVGASKNTSSVLSGTGDSSNRKLGDGNTSWEANARVAGTPWNESKTKFLHVGAGGTYMQLNNNYNADGTFSNGGIEFANTIGGNVDRTNMLDTGIMGNGKRNAPGSYAVDHVTRFGAESAVVYGPFSAQTEYLRTDLSGAGFSGNALDGYYGYATYFLTGESRNYKAKTASWDRIKPNRNFDLKGGLGAWELAAGYDYMNLNSGPVQGGRASVAKFGVNWYLNSHTRFMANYVKALDINTAGFNAPGLVAGTNANPSLPNRYNNADFDIIETRVQLDW